MKILLVNPQYVRGYIHSARWDSITISGTHWYPIFLAYATGLLEKNGHECKLIDAEASNISDEELIKITNDFKPDILVIYISERGLEYNINLAKNIKSTNKCKVVVVGPWASIEPEKILEKYKEIDYLIDGEFEFELLDIANEKKKERYIRSKRLTTKELNELPWVTKVYSKHLDIKKYRVSSLYYPFVDLFTGRKCYWGKCAFCLWPFTILKDGGYFVRDMKDVLDEIEWASKNLHIKEIFIQDDTLSAQRAEMIADGIIERGIKISWSAYARGDLSFKPEILKKMKKSGCHCLHVGYESGNDEILKNINKGVTVKDLEIFTKWVNDAGIEIHGDFMIGLPGETKETALRTIKWAKNLKINTYQFAPPKPYKMTPYYNWLVKNNYIDSDGNPNLPSMTYQEMVDLCKMGMKECYTNPSYIARMMLKPKEWSRIFSSATKLIPYIFFKKSDLPEKK